MKSEWKVTSNQIGSKIMYGVYRTIDIKGIDHSGNREYHSGYVESKEEAVERAKYLNAMEGAKNE